MSGGRRPARPASQPPGPLLADVGEDALLAILLREYGDAATTSTAVPLGPGDDAAVLAPGAGSLVLSTDTLAQGRDFRLDWSSAAEVGRKLVAQNLADVAAMGATSAALLVSVALPPTTPVAWAAELACGIGRECRRAGVTVAGGDLSEASEIVLTATAVGWLPPGATAVRREGARPGDVVALSAVPGASAAGMSLIAAGLHTGPTEQVPGGLADLVRAHVAPEPDYRAGPAALAGGASALIDVSDGLLRDAERVARASGVVLDLAGSALAPADALLVAARTLTQASPETVAAPGADGDAAAGLDGTSAPEDLARAWVLDGGEDHVFLACFPAGAGERGLPSPFRAVGVVRPAAAGEAGVHLDGVPVTAGGWRHFRRS